MAGIEFKNPIMPASGTFGSGQEYSELIDLNQLGAAVTKGVSRHPWAGNPSPRIMETSSGMINAVGLQNPGIDVFLERDIPFLKKFDTKVIVNVCGNTVEEYLQVVERLSEQDVAMLEINISCPNVEHGGIAFGQEPKMVEYITREIKKIAKQPISMKLTPNVTDITEIAKAAEYGGADVLSLINTITGMRIDVKAGQHISRNNGVIYGNGNILGYDRVGDKYVVNEEQAETVRMIFDMYLNDGIGATKIANELCRRQRVAASGQIKWTASNVGRVISNPTYMGYMAYRKSFSNNYLEQKRVNNHNRDTYMYVKADFEPLVSEEDWYKCEQIRKRRRRELSIPMKRKTPFGEEVVTAPKRESHDKWNRKLQCGCGASFRKNRWHKNKNKEWSYGY